MTVGEPAASLPISRPTSSSAGGARGIVHGVVAGSKFGRLGKVQEIVEIDLLIGVDDVSRNRSRNRERLRRKIGIRREAEKPADYRSNGVRAFARSEFKHQTSLPTEAPF